MKNIQVLDQNTIDKIAAGEVIERPASIVKELIENAMDAGANGVTVEIKEGGVSFIRVTDNGQGIEKSQVPTAFLRHATSKIRQVEDLLNVTSLGFRGEALSSIAAVCQVELITKTPEELTGIRYVIEGGMEKSMEEVGAPQGTTFLVRNLFFNTPARKKFLKTATTEAGYINDLLERMALSHPNVAFKFISNNQTRLHTSGNGNLKDVIYGIYGREIASNLVRVDVVQNEIGIQGFIGKPNISRGNRNYENYFINGRYIKSKIISKAIEDAYHNFMMQHKYPFTVLHFTMDGSLMDVNVHPTKMEIRFANNEAVYHMVYHMIKEGLSKKELIPEVGVDSRKSRDLPDFKKPVSVPEPFEQKRILEERKPQPPKTDAVREETAYPRQEAWASATTQPEGGKLKPVETKPLEPKVRETKLVEPVMAGHQLELFEDQLLSKKNVKEYKILGQLFATYWLVEFKDNLYIIDQHAAHEKVLFERTMKSIANKEFTSQQISPPIILTLSMAEEVLLGEYLEHFRKIGYEIEPFGGREYAIRAVPGNMFGIASRALFMEILDGLGEPSGKDSPDIISEKIASMSCKAAVKGNQQLSYMEMDALIGELLGLDNPYNCPHGRPTIISMSKYELEKKFKRIV